MLQHKISTLKNGLRVVTSEMPGLASATIMVSIGGGSRYETKRVSGLFHFIEHMAFKGTKRRPTTLDISSEIDGVGGMFNANTDKEITNYYIKLAADKLELAFDILSDMLNNSLFKAEEIEKEKGVIVEEIHMRNDNYPVLAAVNFERIIYGDNPMGWDIAGEKETVTAFKRADFMEYISKYYYPKNIVLAVSGGVKEDQVLNLANKYFGSFTGDNKKVTTKYLAGVDGAQVNVANKKTEQGHFILGLPALNRLDPRRYQLEVLSAILGGGMSSRLFMTIREKYGLAYYVYGDAQYNTDSGFFVVGAGVKLDKIDQALELTLEELEKIKKDLTSKEIQRAKEMLKGQLVLALEDSRAVAGRTSTQLVLDNKIITVQEVLKSIDAVTEEQLIAVAKEIFQKEKINLAVVGPFTKDTSFKKIIS